MNSENNAQAIIDAVKQLHAVDVRDVFGPGSDKGAPVFIMPKGMEVQSAKPFLDQWLTKPRRIKGTAKAETLESFCDLVKQHKTLDTVVFASRAGTKLCAVIDYHGKSDLGEGSTPSFCTHTIEYAFPISPEFLEWNSAKAWCGQGAFAQFLDARRFELVDPLDCDDIPEGSVMHEVLTRALSREKRGDIHAHKASVFASPGELMQLVETLSGNLKTKFSEVKTDRFGGMRAVVEREGRVDGDEKIPSLFLVQVAAFVGGDKLTLPARIRAQVGERGLQLAAELVGVERVLEKAFEQAVDEVKAKTGCSVFRGSPES